MRIANLSHYAGCIWVLGLITFLLCSAHRYEWVYALRRDFPDLNFSLNGGITSLVQARNVLDHRCGDGVNVRSVMIGRAAYDRPWDVLGNADKFIFGADSNPSLNRRQVLLDYAAIADSRIGSGGKDKKGNSHPSFRVLVKPILNIFHGEAGCKKFKQGIDRHVNRVSSITELLVTCMNEVPNEVLDAPPKEYQESESFATGGLPPPWPLRSGTSQLQYEYQIDEMTSQQEELLV